MYCGYKQHLRMVIVVFNAIEMQNGYSDRWDDPVLDEIRKIDQETKDIIKKLKELIEK